MTWFKICNWLEIRNHHNRLTGGNLSNRPSSVKTLLTKCYPSEAVLARSNPQKALVSSSSLSVCRSAIITESLPRGKQCRAGRRGGRVPWVPGHADP